MGSSWRAYLVGPFYALAPKRWRVSTRHSFDKLLIRAALVSGIVEAVAALIVLGTWYCHYFDILGQRYVAAVETSDRFLVGSEFIGGTGLLTFAAHPLTWLILYFALEGVFRAVGALSTGEVVGTLPLYGIDFLWRLAKRKRAVAELPLVPDEITPGGGICDIVISSCRRRKEWKYPFTLRYAGAYFQVIDEKFMGAGPRPYVYSLRRLPPGEIARGLKNYDPSDVLVSQYKITPIG